MEELPSGKFWSVSQKRLWMLVLFTSCVMLYASRLTMPITIAAISKDFDWSKTDSGKVLSCFFWGYALTQILGGYLSDHIGGERVLLVSVTFWSLLTFCTPDMLLWFDSHSNFWVVIIGRILIGALQGVHFPAIASIVSNNLNSTEKTFFTSVVTSGPAVGMLISGCIGSVILERYGWPYVFRIIGLLSLSWVLLLRYAESKVGAKYFTASSQNREKVKSSSSVPWALLLSKPAFLSVLLAHYTETNSFYILLSWLPTYFNETFTEAKGWVFNVVPWIISPFFTILGGYLAEYLISKGWRVVIVRKILEALCQFSKAFILVIIGQFDSYAGVLLCMALVVAAGGFHCSGVFMNPQDIAPQFAGSVFGIMNTVGSIPGFVGVYLTGYILENSNSWTTVFNLTAFLNILGCTAFLVFGTARPIIPVS